MIRTLETPPQLTTRGHYPSDPEALELPRLAILTVTVGHERWDEAVFNLGIALVEGLLYGDDVQASRDELLALLDANRKINGRSI